MPTTSPAGNGAHSWPQLKWRPPMRFWLIAFLWIAILLIVFSHLFLRGSLIRFYIMNSKDAMLGDAENFLPSTETEQVQQYPLRIAQLAPLVESVPPTGYGGTERVVSNLVEALVALGHSVTLFAVYDSKTSATLVANPKWNATHKHPPMEQYQWMVDETNKRADQFDVIHVHEYYYFSLFNTFPNRTLTTIHWNQDLGQFYDKYRHPPTVSISDDQRKHLGKANFIGTVYHGIPEDLFPFRTEPVGNYFAFIGRITPVKRPEWAIKIALRANVTLKIAAVIHDKNYWEKDVKPLIDQNPERIHFIGQIGDHDKAEFLGNARALIFPVDWDEPFGMVMIEAMACGTPVITRSKGAVPEVVENNVTGIFFDTLDEGVQAVQRIDQLDRTRVRWEFERRFTSKVMAQNYVRLYRQLINNNAAGQRSNNN